MKYAKVQKGNPHRITRWQHVIPLRSLSRFTDSLGFLKVIKRGSPGERRLRPNNSFFCVHRAWDQRAESGYMKSIEDRFQNVAERIISGSRLLTKDECVTVSAFLALWVSRSGVRANPITDRPLRGVTPTLNPPNIDEQEILEMNNFLYFDANGALPARQIAGIQIQRRIDFLMDQMRDFTWGIVSTLNVELIIPDQFGPFAVLPITPRICILANHDNTIISADQVKQINRLSLSVSNKYVAARSFGSCPI